MNQEELRKRIANALTDKTKYCTDLASGIYQKGREDCIEALMKSAKVVYGGSTEAYTHNKWKTDDHTAIIFDIQPIEKPDSKDKLIEDLAKIELAELTHWEFIKRAKKLMKKDIK